MRINIILPVVIIIYLFILDWRIALASLVPLIIGFTTSALMLKGNAMAIFHTSQEGNEKMNSAMVEYVNGMEVIKAFNQTASSMKQYQSAVTNYRDAMTRWFNHVWPYLSIYEVISPMSIAFVLPISGLLLYWPYNNRNVVYGRCSIFGHWHAHYESSWIYRPF